MTTLLLIGAGADIPGLELQDLDRHSAPNIDDGLALAQQTQPDVIVYAPAGSPAETLNRITADPALGAVPVLVILDDPSLGEIRRWMNAGADDCLPRAALPGELSAALHARLARKAAFEGRYIAVMDTLRYTVTSAMPHEFRTALVGILGFSSMLKDEADSLAPAQVRDMATHIEKSATRMHRQVESYSWYSRLKAQEIIGSTTGLAVDRILENPAELIRGLSYQHAERYRRAADLSVTLDTTPVGISDEYLQKILDEVLDNAFKFSKPGTPVLVSAVVDGVYTICIHDHGRGMTADQIDQIGAYMQFERRQHEQQGIGMGLEIARGLAQLHGGHVTIRSAPGEGTEVVLALPLAHTTS